LLAPRRLGLDAGLDDVGVEGDTINNGSDQPGVGEDGSPFAERRVGGQGDGGPFPLSMIMWNSSPAPFIGTAC